MHAILPRIVWSVCLLSTLPGLCLAQGGLLGGTKVVANENLGSATGRRTRVFRLKHTPVLDAARSIERVLKSSPGSTSSTLVPEPISNSLIVSAPVPTIERVEQLVEAIDVRPPTVTVDLLVVETDKPRQGNVQPVSGTSMDAKQLAIFLDHHNLQVAYRTQISTLNNQPCFEKFGFPKPTDGERPDRSGSGVASSLSLGITPRVVGDGPVIMQLDLVLSSGERHGGVAQRPSTVTQQSTLSVDPGKTVVLGGLQTGGEHPYAMYLLAWAKIGEGK